MSTQEQKSQEVKDKIKTQAVTPQEEPPKPIEKPAEDDLMVIYNRQQYWLSSSDVNVNFDKDTSSKIVDAVENALSNKLERRVSLRGHQFAPLPNGQYVVTPQATYG